MTDLPEVPLTRFLSRRELEEQFAKCGPGPEYDCEGFVRAYIDALTWRPRGSEPWVGSVGE